MASSNRHWPSMFKSKHCNAHHLQWHNEVNPSGLLSGSCHRPEERAPEPKPRWNPKPEQIRILEGIFNSGMVNPPRDEIRRIRAQLQEYGQVGDANVFYWFQNRKSRSKHKLRHLQSQKQQQRTNSASHTSLPVPTSSSSSSSTERSGSSKPTAAGAAASPTLAAATTGQGTSEFVAYLSSLMETSGGQWGDMVSSEGHCKSTTGGGEGKVEQLQTSVYNGAGSGVTGEGLAVVTTTTATSTPTAITNSIIGGAQGDEAGVVGGSGGGVGGREAATPVRSLLIFINDVAFEVGADHLNVRAAFGETAMLLHSSGQPVLVDQWGITLHPLENGASYYLV